jgi:hypothetical protein
LELLEVQLEGRRAMTAEEMMRGLKLGEILFRVSH